MLELLIANEELILGILALAGIVFVVASRGDVSKLFGPRVNLFNPVRRAFIPIIDRTLSKYGGYAETNVYEREYAGTFRGELEDLENALYDFGYLRYPLASMATTPDGRSETASWAYHKHIWSKRQTHVRIYDSNPDVNDNRGWDLYVHNEYTAHHPLYAMKHYDGQGMEYESAIVDVRQHLYGEGIDLGFESTKGDFEPPKRNSLSNDSEE